VAILYGFALIVAAFVLAMLYGWLCRDSGDDAPSADQERRR
jgi:hypothetical protein